MSQLRQRWVSEIFTVTSSAALATTERRASASRRIVSFATKRSDSFADPFHGRRKAKEHKKEHAHTQKISFPRKWE